MCLLIFLPAGRRPDQVALRTGAAVNGDGHGFAIVTADRLIVDKGLDGEAMVAAFVRARAAHPDGPALFHSRIRTHGQFTVDNCHPFPVGGDPRTVIAHNGILPVDVHPAKGDNRSDTRIAAEDYLPRLGPLRLRRTRLRLERWMGPTNLMALLTIDRRYRERAYLFNEAAGIWDDGIWYSNDSYQPGRSRCWSRWDEAPAGAVGSGWPRHHRSRPGVPFCAACGEVADLAGWWCPWCGHCWSCAEPPDRCDCWAPAALTSPAGPTGS